MPMHFNSITNNDQSPELLAWLLREGMEECNSVFISEDKRYFHLQRNIIDRLSSNVIGKTVYTIKHGETMLEVLDVDITLANEIPTSIQFNTLRPGSSDANEYYEAEVDNGGHLELETVNRHTRNSELVGKELEAFVSIFPFELSIFENIEEFNKWAGFDKEISVGGTDFKVGGFSEHFIMPGGMLGTEKRPDESCSFLIGTVVSFRSVEIAIGEIVLPFVLAQVDTALGVVPVAMGPEVFDLSKLHPGSVVAMNADVKADLSKKDDFTYHE